MENSRNKQSTSSKWHVALSSMMRSCKVEPHQAWTWLTTRGSTTLSDWVVLCVIRSTVPAPQCWCSSHLVFLNNGPRNSGRAMLAIWIHQREARKCPASGKVRTVHWDIWNGRETTFTQLLSQYIILFLFYCCCCGSLRYLICKVKFPTGVCVWEKTWHTQGTVQPAVVPGIHCGFGTYAADKRGLLQFSIHNFRDYPK